MINKKINNKINNKKINKNYKNKIAKRNNEQSNLIILILS